ncbi:MAG: hypothetical protein Q9161_003055 [Pseudevernia consocians]
MGRYDFRPLRVHQTATLLLNTERLSRTPPWYNVVASITPAQTLVRTQPLPHQQRKAKSRTKKPSKLFQPQTIHYEEDALRKEFFKDHPWELARPRLVIEDDGKDSQKTDWSRIEQPEKALSGESVVQRQLWLQHNVPGITSAQAYDQARKEFYDLRLQEDVERRVAKEEAMSTGAYFGKSALDIGMELEDKEYERWKEWAAKEVVLAEQRRAAMYTGGVESGDMAVDSDPAEYEAALEEVSDQIPAQGQSALGGAMIRP